MKPVRCLLGFHDFYNTFHPLILAQRGTVRVSDGQVLDVKNFQYMTVKRICLRPKCKKKEEYIVQLANALQDWDVLLSAPNFASEEWKKDERNET